LAVESNRILLSSKEIASFLKETCQKKVSFKFTARGMSMAPFICDGDALIIEPITENKIPVIGDIVAFINPAEGFLVIHRVIRIQNNEYLLKGDNVYYNDNYCHNKDIHGIVKKIVITKDRFHGPDRVLRKMFLFVNNFKKTIAFLSRHNLLTLMCRLINKLILNNNNMINPS